MNGFQMTYSARIMQLFLQDDVYFSVEELQGDLDEGITFYNEERTQSRKYCDGKTFYAKLSLSLARDKF
ncbi:MAG: hypothetical protein NZM38_11420 [Cytophagales bacterium]|nr:hypothetical protein [Cytophagales bacterium]MDW8385366.1 hypothetical protein [Flammeovirgaceae bacterium]